MNRELSIRRATAADLAAVLDLIREGLGVGAIPRTSDYWRWKHVENPFGPSPILVAEDDGRFIGLRAFMRWGWRSGEQQVTAVRAVDTATHPEYRGRGIFRRLTVQLRSEMEHEGATFVYNTPNTQSRPGYLKMGWTVVGKPTLWIRPVQPVRLARALRREGLGGSEGDPPQIDAPSAGEALDRPGVQALIEAAGRTSMRPLHTPLTLRYLRWRYAAIPGFRYHALSEGDGEDGALLVVRSRRRGALREIRVCDIVVGPSRAANRNARSLLRLLPHLADVDVVLAMDTRRSRLRRALFASGFVPAPRSGPVLTAFVFPGEYAVPDPRRLSSWGTSVGDLELF
jgi:GNAT superfamily N-acetyltransferase